MCSLPATKERDAMSSEFGRCNKCMAINWDSVLYMRTHGITGCRRCGSNETRWNGKVSLPERLYLLFWFIWETHMLNRESEDGEPDPNWWMNPMNVLRVVWAGLHPDLGFEKGESDGTAQETCLTALCRRAEPDRHGAGQA